MTWPIPPTVSWPANLEARWNTALSRVAEAEAKIAAHEAARPTPSVSPTSQASLAADLKSVWTAPSTDARLKKRIVRTLIHEVIADVDQDAAEIVLVIHWIGGIHNEIRLPRRRRGQRNSTSADIIDVVRQLALIANDDVIAGVLNRNGLVAGHGNRWTREGVMSLRSHHRIPVFKPAAHETEPWLNRDAARIMKVAAKLSGWRPALARSKLSIHCRMVPGSSPALIFPHQPPAI